MNMITYMNTKIMKYINFKIQNVPQIPSGMNSETTTSYAIIKLSKAKDRSWKAKRKK